MKVSQQTAQQWEQQIETDHPQLPQSTRTSIVQWLMGPDADRFNDVEPAKLSILKSAIHFRYQILCKRYLGEPPERAYRNLIQRLSSLVLIGQKIRTWVSLSRDRHRTVVDVMQEIIQEMLQVDRYLQQQMAWIAQCTTDRRLSNTLLLATTEEYCLRPIRNQPLLVYRFVNYLRRTQRGGLTNVPASELIRLISEEVSPSDNEGIVSLFDTQVLNDYQQTEALEERQMLRESVRREFETYLEENIGPSAVKWLQLYLEGRSQEEIATALNLPVRQLYRLREKITYHAIRVFAQKIEPELVGTWLETSLNENALGLSRQQWQQYTENLSPLQKEIIDLLKAGHPLEKVASILKLKPNLVISEWNKLYLAAQLLRNS